MSVSIDAVDACAVNVFEGILWYCIIASCWNEHDQIQIKSTYYIHHRNNLSNRQESAQKKKNSWKLLLSQLIQVSTYSDKEVELWWTHNGFTYRIVVIETKSCRPKNGVPKILFCAHKALLLFSVPFDFKIRTPKREFNTNVVLHASPLENIGATSIVKRCENVLIFHVILILAVKQIKITFQNYVKYWRSLKEWIESIVFFSAAAVI